MSYSNYEFETFPFPSQSFATSVTRKIRLPKGMRGRLKDVHLEGTTLFTNVTTGATIQLGVAGQLAAFGTFNPGALAAGAVYRATINEPKAIIDTELPMDTEIVVTITAPTGGTPAGVGNLSFLINEY